MCSVLLDLTGGGVSSYCLVIFPSQGEEIMREGEEERAQGPHAVYQLWKCIFPNRVLSALQLLRQ